MYKLVLMLFLGAISTAAPYSLEDDPLAIQYRGILLKNHSGAHHAKGLSPSLRKEFLSQPIIKDLVSLYRKSVRKTGHPAQSPSRQFISALQRLFEKHLVEIAMRTERVELNHLVKNSFEGMPSELHLESRHMQILGRIFDDFTIDTAIAYKNKDLEKMQDYGALTLYVLMESYIRQALFSLGIEIHLSRFERIARVLGPDETEVLASVFWSNSNMPDPQDMAFAIQTIENFSAKDFSELVTHYQTIFAEQSCEELLASRHPSGER